jgi:hypothetical protein
VGEALGTGRAAEAGGNLAVDFHRPEVALGLVVRIMPISA